MTDKPGVSVILPTLNREDFLIPAIHDLLKQTYTNMEIVIVDQSDHLSAAVFKVASADKERIKYYHVRFRGLPVARNFGWQKARHDIVIFLDDDIRAPATLVEEHVKALLEPNVGIVAGGVDEPNRNLITDPKTIGRFSYWTATPTRGFQSRQTAEVHHAQGCNFSVWKKVLNRVGGFDEEFSRGTALYEELDFCLRVRRAGFRIVFNPEARITHLVAPTGGCRVPHLGNYLRSLSRNRAMVILRYLRWYHLPTAMIRLLQLNLSYVITQKDPGALVSGMRGLVEGCRLANADPKVTRYQGDGPNA